MKVTAQPERLNHSSAVRHVRQNAQLQLAIVSHNQFGVGLSNEGFANLVNVLFSGRLVLKVWLPTAQPTSFSVQVHGAVNAAMLVFGRHLQRVDIRCQEGLNRFKIAPVFEGDTHSNARLFVSQTLVVFIS